MLLFCRTHVAKKPSHICDGQTRHLLASRYRLVMAAVVGFSWCAVSQIEAAENSPAAPAPAAASTPAAAPAPAPAQAQANVQHVMGVESLPPGALAIIEQHVPGGVVVELDAPELHDDDPIDRLWNIEVYQAAQGGQPANVVDIFLNPDGTFANKQADVASNARLQAVPPAVSAAVAQQFPGGILYEAEADDGVYECQVLVNRMPQEVNYRPDGTVAIDD